MATKAYGRIVFWQGASLWVLRAPPGEKYPKTDPHSHHALQVTLALTGRIDFDVEGSPEPLTGPAIAIAADWVHAFEGTGLVAHLFVASDGEAGRRIARGLLTDGPTAMVPLTPLEDLPARLRATFEESRHTVDDLRVLGQELVDRLAGDSLHPSRPDPRVVRLIEWVEAHLDETITLEQAAAFVSLSPGRARHLFVGSTGLPFRTYLLWQRLVRAVELYSDRASLTDAAHGAGFADSAHLSRTFRRMFGIAASTLDISLPAASRAGV
jgi:AraC family transcriptional regulator